MRELVSKNRSIFLRNTHAGFLNQIIQKLIKKIIYHDQVGFIPEMQKFNIHKLINVIHHIHKLEDKKHLILLVAAKAFDMIQHPFVVNVLERLGV